MFSVVTEIETSESLLILFHHASVNAISALIFSSGSTTSSSSVIQIDFNSHGSSVNLIVFVSSHGTVTLNVSSPATYHGTRYTVSSPFVIFIELASLNVVFVLQSLFLLSCATIILTSCFSVQSDAFTVIGTGTPQFVRDIFIGITFFVLSSPHVR
ncbi:hypothetical protein IJU97_01135 [bacterium]|nr:hypothetical protein [bacterium]